MKKNIIFAIVLVLVAAGFFYGGMRYQAGKTPTRGQFAGGPPGMVGQGFMNRSGNTGLGFISGEILGKDDQSLTVKLNDGGSKTIFYSASTTIGKMASGTPADLIAGTPVMVTGKTTSDGSLTAESIQIRTGSEPLGPGAPASPRQQ
ncbi:MAG TPA: DUF5666 domain-containing protein [bacterium]|nr:DUF5666 domain-containing protein [bacterium]